MILYHTVILVSNYSILLNINITFVSKSNIGVPGHKPGYVTIVATLYHLLPTREMSKT